MARCHGWSWRAARSPEISGSQAEPPGCQVMLGKHPTDVISENQGKGRGPASNHLFLLSFSKKKKEKNFFFLMKRGGWGRLITLPTSLMVPRRGHGLPSRSTGEMPVSFRWGVPWGEHAPAGTRVTWGLSHSITPLTAPWRLL